MIPKQEGNHIMAVIKNKNGLLPENSMVKMILLLKMVFTEE
jgi:hypothetical protein